MGNLKVAGLDIGTNTLTVDTNGTLLVNGNEVSGSGGGGISYVWANETARTATTGMKTEEQGLQQDTGIVYKYTGSAWEEYYVMSDSTVQKYYEGTSAPINSKIGDEWFDYNDGTLYKRVSDGTDSVWMAMNSLIGGGDSVQYDIGSNEFVLPYTRNGKRVYGREVDFGTLPNTATKTVPIPEYNASYKYWIDFQSSYSRNYINHVLGLSFAGGNVGIDYSINAAIISSDIRIITYYNFSSYIETKVVLHYTK